MKLNQYKNQILVFAGFIMILANAIAYLSESLEETPIFLILGLTFVAIGLVRYNKKPK